MFTWPNSRNSGLREKRLPGRIGVVISTYNQPERLAKTLLSYTLQSDENFDVILADDGSDERTAHVMRRFSDRLSIHHVWHPDDGFRKCEILNRAVAASDHDYLIFTDGDCIAAPNFVSVHRRFAQPNRFLSGTYNNLPSSFNDIIDEDSVINRKAFELDWLRQQGLRKSKMDLRMHRSLTLRRILNTATTTRPTWNGCNSSGWRSDLITVNGFDERMGYGGEDRELGYRLERAGVRGCQIRFHAICLHCDHARGYVDETQLKQNLLIRNAAKRKTQIRTLFGIDEMLQRRPLAMRFEPNAWQRAQEDAAAPLASTRRAG